MSEHVVDEDMALRAPTLARLKRVRHAFFTRAGGVSQGVYASLNGGLGSNDDPASVTENRRRMTAALGVPEGALAMAYQVHSPSAVVTDRAWQRGERPRADAVVTNTPNLAVGVTVADCGPILLADDDAGVVAAVHAGWKGALDGVVEAAIREMERLGAQRARIVAALGPLIRRESYEVGPEFAERFRQADSYNRVYFSMSDRVGHYMFDLPRYIVERLLLARVGTIQDLGVDTYGDEERFFSYRRSVHRNEPDYGRLVAAIALTG
jgi:YfiH family protein